MTANRRNPDYSASAVKLCNPPEVKELLLAQKNRMVNLSKLQEKIDNYIPPELKAELEQVQHEIEIEDKSLRGYIDTFGSYQDVEAGMYAVKQCKKSANYEAEALKKLYPQFSTAVIVETVNKTAIEGLIKGGLLYKARLESEGVLVISESFAYVVKVL